VDDGAVSTARALPATAPLSIDDKACAKAIGEALAARGALRGVTVAVRLDDAARAAGRGLDVGGAWAEAIKAGGLQANLLSTVVPAAKHGEEGTVFVSYAEVRSGVVSVEAFSGPVTAGASEAEMELVTAGQVFPPATRFQTGPGGAAWLGLADGSRLRLLPEAAIVVESVRIDPKIRRVVKVRLIEGEVVADVRAAAPGSSFDIITPQGEAAVKGTLFRMRAGKRKTKLETLAGKVDLSGEGGTVSVAEKQGSQMDQNGIPEPPRDLLAGPDVDQPRFGPLPADGTLKWAAVGGAKGYAVEMARDAEFVLALRTESAAGTTLAAPGDLAPGKWFWRVAALDKDDFRGNPSKVFAFEK
jgi:hypothetical protein